VELNKCEKCGAPIRRSRGENFTRYSNRRYCSVACANGDSEYLPSTAEGHNCLHCGQPIRRHGAPWADFMRRQFCCGSCRAQHKFTCDCGNQITQHLWVVQLSAEGWAYAVQLDLCDACAALVPEATPVRPEIAANEYAFRPGRRQRVSQTEFADESWHVCKVAYKRWHG